MMASVTFVMPESRGISLPHCLFHRYTFYYKQIAQEECIPSLMNGEHPDLSA
jgi:hypothetical protein